MKRELKLASKPFRIKPNLDCRAYPDEKGIETQNGLSIPASPLAAGSFVSTITPCYMTSGYWGASIKEAAAKWLLLPADATGTNVQKRCDYYNTPNYVPGVLLVGGYWYDGATTGVAFRDAGSAASTSYRTIGGRLEFCP